MTAYKLKRFPAPFNSRALAGVTQSCAFILAANWLMQGVRGMDRKELAFRLLLEAALTAVRLAALAPLGGPAAAGRRPRLRPQPQLHAQRPGLGLRRYCGTIAATRRRWPSSSSTRSTCSGARPGWTRRR